MNNVETILITGASGFLGSTSARACNLLRHPYFNQMREENQGFRIIGKLVNIDQVVNGTFWDGVLSWINRRSN